MKDLRIESRSGSKSGTFTTQKQCFLKMQDVFDPSGKEAMINRINKLTPATQPLWGKMDVAQMLAHCNLIPFEMIYDTSRPRPNPLTRLILKLLVKPVAAGSKPYKKNSPTGPEFKITTPKNFEEEKKKLIGYINKTAQLGPDYFLDKQSPFGKLTKVEWTYLFYKHLNHHLTQFGV